MLITNCLNASADALPVRPIVLLAITDEQVGAKYAYVLFAAGFDVVMPDATGAAFSALGPDLVLIDLRDLPYDAPQSAWSCTRDLLDEVPIVALVPDVGRSWCECARRVGCAAVCLSTCSAEVLAAGLRAVLERSGGQTGRVRDDRES